MFFQPPDEESFQSKANNTPPTHNNIRRRRKKKFPLKKKQKKEASKKRHLRLASTMSSWAETFTNAATWQLKHQLAYWKSRAKALEYENRILHDIIRKNCTNSNREASNVDCVVGLESDLENGEDDEEELEEDEEDREGEENFEVSEEFIQFLTANAKYKQEAKHERERLKAKLAAEEVVEMEERASEDQVNNEETMKELYGDKWERIAALEISLQSQFLNDRDKEKPMYWPNIPFNFNFG